MRIGVMAIGLGMAAWLGLATTASAQGRAAGAMAPDFPKLDMNDDGSLTMDELEMAMPVQEGWFDASALMALWDGDENGAVSMDEFMARKTGGRGRTP